MTDILGFTLSPEVSSFYDEVMAIDPNLRFSRDMAPDGTRGTVHEKGKDGVGVIYLADDASDALIAHALFHHCIWKRGAPYPYIVPGVGSSYTKLAQAVECLVTDARMYSSLRERGIGFEEQWEDWGSRMANWSSEEPGLETEGGIGNVHRVARYMASCPLDKSKALDNIAERYPKTYELSIAIGQMIGQPVLSRRDWRRRLVDVLVTYQETILLEMGIRRPDRTIGIYPVFRDADMPLAANRFIEVIHFEGKEIAYLHKPDNSLIISIPDEMLRPARPEEILAVMRDNLRLSLARFLATVDLKYLMDAPL